jgi:deoxyribodipyrimidine photolyase-related protein
MRTRLTVNQPDCFVLRQARHSESLQSLHTMRTLILVLGDQLDAASAAFDGMVRADDAVWMAEVAEEAAHVPTTKPRLTLFLSAMRHFAEARRAEGWVVHYTRLDDATNTGSLAGELTRVVQTLHPSRLVVVEPGEWRVREQLLATAASVGVPLEIRPDRHFFSSVDDFRRHAEGRSQLRMEFFYREMRRRYRVLLDADGKPEGGSWNYDADNRGSFGKKGPPLRPEPFSVPQDAITREVIALVNRLYPDRAGDLSRFDWPVTPAQARAALDLFLTTRLPDFGRYQDAMWTGEPWLYHARISAAMNLKLLDPRVVIEGAERAYRAGHVSLPNAEGFIRQVLGWREYVRGIYWLHMPGYVRRNALGAHLPLPPVYWTGETDMRCLHDVITQTLTLGYAHHIQRLMVTGLYALLLGVDPREVHEWYLAVYVDAVEWVELPNTLGMSQYADGGVMASKPYVATGKYIDRMSNYCSGCRYDPAKATGPTACPMTTLYWDFLSRHEATLVKNPRMSLQVKNLARLSPADRQLIADHARDVRRAAGAEGTGNNRR